MMGDHGVGMNPAQQDSMMQHSLAMVQNQNRKCTFDGVF